jgi:hypothetical protein
MGSVQIDMAYREVDLVESIDTKLARLVPKGRRLCGDAANMRL